MACEAFGESDWPASTTTLQCVVANTTLPGSDFRSALTSSPAIPRRLLCARSQSFAGFRSRLFEFERLSRHSSTIRLQNSQTVDTLGCNSPNYLLRAYEIHRYCIAIQFQKFAWGGHHCH